MALYSTNFYSKIQSVNTNTQEHLTTQYKANTKLISSKYQTLMFSVQPLNSSLLVKRHQFYSSIRKKQLDDYRQKKRIQLFGTGKASNAESDIYLNVSSNKQRILKHHNIKNPILSDLAKSIPIKSYPFNQRIQQNFIGQSEKMLNAQKYSIDSINMFLSRLVTLQVKNLADSDINDRELLNRALKILSKCMAKIMDIPYNSTVRVSHIQTIEEIIKKSFQSVKFILKSMVQVQQCEIQQTIARQRIKSSYKAIIYNKPNNHLNIKNHQNARLRLEQIEQQEKKIPVHPLQLCIGQVDQIVCQFYELYSQIYQRQSQALQEQHSDQCYLYLNYFNTLWYLLSFLQSPLFTSDLVQLYLRQMQSLYQIQTAMIDPMLETLCNFVLTQSHVAKNQDIQRVQTGEIKYSTQITRQICQTLGFALKNYEMTASSSSFVVKSAKHILNSRPMFALSLLIQNDIIKQLVLKLGQQRNQVIQTMKQFQNGQIQKQMLRQKIDTSIIQPGQKMQIYEFLGMVLCRLYETQVTQHYSQIFQLVASISKLVAYELKTLLSPVDGVFNQKEQQQKTIESLMFMMMNMFSMSSQIIHVFIQSSILNDLIRLWSYCQSASQFSSEQNSVQYSTQRYGLICRIRTTTLNVITNMIFVLTSPEMRRQIFSENWGNLTGDQINCLKNDSLEVIVDLQEMGIVKIMLSYLKNVAFGSQPAFINKQTVFTTSCALRRMLQFVMARDLGAKMIKSFLNCHQFSLKTLQQVLNIIMMSQNNGESIPDIAVKCLQILDQIIKENGRPQQQIFEKRQYQEVQQNQNHGYSNQNSKAHQNQGDYYSQNNIHIQSIIGHQSNGHTHLSNANNNAASNYYPKNNSNEDQQIQI